MVQQKRFSQRDGCALVKQNLHSDGFFHGTSRCVSQNDACLLCGHAWKPREEIVQRRIVLKIFEQR